MASQGCSHSHSHSHSLSHRHHQHHCPHCPLRRHCRHCPLHNPHFPPTLLQPLFPSLPQNAPLSPLKQPTASDAQISQELENTKLYGEEEDDEPVFVLTDEWREFFAKSEAKRKIEKKQGNGNQKK